MTFWQAQQRIVRYSLRMQAYYTISMSRIKENFTFFNVRESPVGFCEWQSSKILQGN